jgi:hypothetical protein
VGLPEKKKSASSVADAVSPINSTTTTTTTKRKIAKK